VSPQSEGPASAAAVAGLAREVEALSRRLGRVATEAEAANESAGTVNRALADVVDRIEALAATIRATRKPAALVGQPGVRSWLTMDDELDARRELAALVQWLARVFLQYPDGAAALGECWLWHPTVVEELTWLRYAWLDAYVGEAASAARAGDWHDRQRPGVVRRLATLLGDCSLAAHSRGGRADRVTPGVPAAAAVDDMAVWWTASHGSAPAPAPAAGLLTQSEAGATTY
jgi:hypothetical protein